MPMESISAPAAPDGKTMRKLLLSGIDRGEWKGWNFFF